MPRVSVNPDDARSHHYDCQVRVDEILLVYPTIRRLWLLASVKLMMQVYGLLFLVMSAEVDGKEYREQRLLPLTLSREPEVFQLWFPKSLVYSQQQDLIARVLVTGRLEAEEMSLSWWF